MNNTRVNVFSGATCVLVIMALLVLGCGRFFGSKGETSGVDFKKAAANLPKFNPNDPPPSPGAASLRTLAELEPNVAQLIDGVEAVERSAIRKTVAEIEIEFKDSGSPAKKSVGLQRLMRDTPTDTLARSTRSQGPAAAMLLFQGGQSTSPIGGSHDAAVVAVLISGLSDILTPYLKETVDFNKSTTETKDGTTTTMSVEFGRSDDGATKFGLGVKTETMKNGVSATSELKAKIEGQRCPDAEGQLPYTVNVRLGAESGGVILTRDVTAVVRAVVSDDAHVVSYMMDLSQATRQVKDGKQIYIETASTMTQAGGYYEESNFRVVRSSQDATAENSRPLAAAGHEAAFMVGATTLASAELGWLNGGCTKIEAKSPGTVPTNSTNAIPVKVVHKFDGSEVPSKLDAVLKGEKSVDPTTLARTAGTLTYTAPNEKNKSATISLTATSRRGRATLDLAANTGGQSYRVTGVSNNVSFSGEICSLEKPFVINGTFPGGGSAKTTFEGGATTMSGGGGGCTQSGGGSYTVTSNEDGSGTITWTSTAVLTCPGVSNKRTATFTLPLTPAPDISCQ